MTKNELEIGQALLTLIETTSIALNSIDNWISISTKRSIGGKYKTDFNYNLCISEYQDGSGNRVNLTRYFGNTDILSLIRNEIKEQLTDYENALKNL